MRGHSDIQQAIDCLGPAVWRACVLHFKATPDAEDAFQETFLKYALHEGSFNDDEHKKAWLLRVAMNTCNDMLRRRHRSDESFEAIEQGEGAASVSELRSEDPSVQPGSSLGYVIDAINNLGDPPRTAVYLVLYEEYSAKEVADMLDVPLNTVYSWVSRGKRLLREALA